MEVVDTVRTVETPEGVELPLRPAGPLARGLALALDQLLVWGCLFAAMMPLALFGPVGIGIWVVLLFLGQWLYPVACEVWGGGRTLGKRALGLRVLCADGTPVGWGPSLLRNLLRFVDALPFGYTVGLVCLLLTRDHQRVGDLVAGTLVVHEPLPHRAPVPPGPALPLPSGLTLEEQGAILGFGERCGTLTAARAAELADLLEPLTGQTGEAGVQALQAMARTVRGMA